RRWRRKYKESKGQVMDLETKRQFVFDVAEKLGWQAFNYASDTETRTVYCAKGNAVFHVKISGYALPNHQVNVYGDWPKCKIPKSGRFAYRPNVSKSINVSARKSVDVAARDIKKRFLDWFVDMHEKMTVKRDKFYADWCEEEQSLKDIAEKIGGARIERTGGRRYVSSVTSEKIVRKGDLSIGQYYTNKWTVAIDGLSVSHAVKISQFIHSVVEDAQQKSL
ncbi:MAG: hypothetical protein AAGD96_33170, partial [Chloroflexota bacterium]